jgi:predicted acylesterase/phospholipase RssA
VTLTSAVAASCLLPGAMKPTKLMMKNNNGEQIPLEVDGVEWIDGSVQADLPFKRISTSFNISNFVVCQTKFHVGKEYNVLCAILDTVSHYIFP